jgi:hypothetical protein
MNLYQVAKSKSPNDSIIDEIEEEKWDLGQNWPKCIILGTKD